VCSPKIAGEDAHSVVLPDRLLDDQTPDAAGGSDDEHGHAWGDRAETISSIARMRDDRARSLGLVVQSA
jgi:hypothetical protein